MSQDESSRQRGTGTGSLVIGEDAQLVKLLCEEARRFAGLIFWVFDLRTKCFNATGSAEQIPEWQFDKAVPLKIVRSHVAPEDRHLVATALYQLVEQKQAFEGTIRFSRLSGLRRFIETRAYPIFDHERRVTLIQGLSRDVTDRVTVDMIRRQLTDRYRDFMRFSPHMPWVADPAGRIVEMSPRYEVLTGAPRTVWKDETWLKHFHPDDIPGMVAAVTHALATGQPYESEYRILFRDGQYHWVRASAVAQRNPAGAIIAWYGVTEDIDRRKTLELGQGSPGAGPDIGRTTGMSLAVTGQTDGTAPDANLTAGTLEVLAKLIMGHHFRAARTMLDLSMADFAKISGLSFSTIRRLEENSGSQSSRSRSTAVKALIKAGVRFSILYDGSVAIARN